MRSKNLFYAWFCFPLDYLAFQPGYKSRAELTC